MEENGARKKGGRIFVALTLGLTTILLLTAFSGGKNVLRNVLSSDPLWLLIALLDALAVVAVDALRISILSGWKVSYWCSVKTSIYGFYASAITPFASGGQPFQIYYLTKLGLGVERASMIVSVKFISSFTISVIWGLFAITKYGYEIYSIQYVGKLMYLGVSLTLAFYFFFVILALNAKFGKWFLSLPIVVKPMAFFLKKSEDEVYSKVDSKISGYRETLISLWRDSKTSLVISMLLSLVMVTLILVGPYLALKAVGEEISVFYAISMTAAMSMIFYFIPTPGASGGVEGVFYLVFSKIISPEVAASALIIWRFFSYHLSLIMGAVLSAGYVLRSGESG